jgi:hypothetical protein
MNKSDLWRIYCDKNPQFANDDAKITMTGRGLQKLFDQTYDAGYQQAMVNTGAKNTTKGDFETLKRFMGM